jgi:hypothetical protein
MANIWSLRLGGSPGVVTTAVSIVTIRCDVIKDRTNQGIPHAPGGACGRVTVLRIGPLGARPIFLANRQNAAAGIPHRQFVWYRKTGRNMC